MCSTKMKDFQKNRGVIMYFNRKKYLDKLIAKMNNSLIKVITGARRSGKSFLMNNIFYNYLKSIEIFGNQTMITKMVILPVDLNKTTVWFD